MDFQLFFFALFTGIYYWFSASVVGYTFSDAFYSPVIVGFCLGLLLGDLTTGLMLGATIQLIYIGIIGAGGNWPADECIAALIVIPLAIKTNMSIEAAAALAVPISFLGVFITNLRRAGNVVFAHWADAAALRADDKAIFRCAAIWPSIWSLILYGTPVFVANYFGARVIEPALDMIPEWIMNAFEIAGGMLPALGIAMTLTLIGKKHNFALFFIAFFVVIYTGMNVMLAAIIGTCIALLMVFNKNRMGGSEA